MATIKKIKIPNQVPKTSSKVLPDPPNGKSPTFVKYWDKYIGEVTNRANFREGHLVQLEVLCDLYVEYETLNDVVNLEGYTYTISGRNGDQRKLTPEAQQLTKTRSEILAYLKHLGLVLFKDTGEGGGKGKEEKDEWE